MIESSIAWIEKWKEAKKNKNQIGVFTLTKSFSFGKKVINKIYFFFFCSFLWKMKWNWKCFIYEFTFSFECTSNIRKNKFFHSFSCWVFIPLFQVLWILIFVFYEENCTDRKTRSYSIETHCCNRKLHMFCFFFMNYFIFVIVFITFFLRLVLVCSFWSFFFLLKKKFTFNWKKFHERIFCTFLNIIK